MPTRRIDEETSLNRSCNGQAPDPYRPDAERVRQTNDAAEAASVAGDGSLPPLSEADQHHLLECQKKTQLVRDRVVGVVRGRALVELAARNLVDRRHD